MNATTLKTAIAEARRFLRAAAAFELRAKDDKYIWNGTKEGGSLRRASLDLTRALAELRKY